MYARFFRWASDRVDENGVVAFVSNRSFIESRIFDGFRRVVGREFSEVWVLDLGGDVRANPKLSGTKHNVFGIQTGVAISFLVKRKKAQGCRIFYSRRPELETAEEKLAFLGDAKLPKIAFEEIRPDKNSNWIKQASNDFPELMPLFAKSVKLSDRSSQDKAVFKLYSLGIVTNRDDWAYDDDRDSLAQKVQYFCDAYRAEMNRWKSSGRPKATSDFVDRSIKWTSELENHMQRGTELKFEPANLVRSQYRPFVSRYTYFAQVITHRPYQNFSLFPDESHPNMGFSIAVEERSEFGLIAVDRLPNKDMFARR